MRFCFIFRKVHPIVIPVTLRTAVRIEVGLSAESGVPGALLYSQNQRNLEDLGMGVKTTYVNKPFFLSCIERHSIGHSNSPLRWYFSSGALVLILFLHSDYRNQKRLLCRKFHMI